MKSQKNGTSFTVEGPQNSRNISGLQNKCYASMVFFMHEIKYFEFDMSVEYSCYNSYFGFRRDHTIMHNVANNQKSHNSYKLCQLTMVTQHAQLHAKDYKIGICCFSAKHAALRRKSKDWLVRVIFV
jgi:hypothetical protein